MTTDQRIGARIGAYLIEEQIGRGGMGVVFRARHETTGQIVALKLMAPEIADSEDFRERFTREAHLAFSLEHPHVVRVYDAGEVDGELFIAMELVPGPDLKTLLRDQGPLEPSRALALFGQMASALDTAHEMGIIHRDVKPQNILVAAGNGSANPEHVYITDFGLVRPMSSETTASRTGQVFGSLQYMAPELIEALPADGRADVYSLGCMLYECLTGVVPFERPNEVAVVWAQIHEDPPLPSSARPELPSGIDDVVLRAMSKHPDDRFLTCGEFVEELEDGMGRKQRRHSRLGMRPLVERKPREKTEREVWAPNFFPELRRVRKESEKPNWFQVVGLAGTLVLLATLLVHFGREGGIVEAVADVGDAGRSLIETVTGDEEAPEPKPHGQRDGLASSKQDRNQLLARGGTAEELAAHIARDIQGDKSADDRAKGLSGGSSRAGTRSKATTGTIVFSRSDTSPVSYYSLYTMNADGSGERLLYSASVQRNDHDPDWSPDGRWIAFASESSIKKIRADGTEETTLETLGGWSQDPTWSPDGEYVAFGHTPQGSGANHQGGEWDIWVAPADGSWMPSRLTESAGLDQWPDWSPDGSRIAFSSERRRGRDICFIKIETLARGCLTSRAGDEIQPAWSPDGSKIAFVGASSSGRDIFVKTLATGRITRITNDGRGYHPGWSPDGRWIVFSNGRAEEWESGVANQEVRKARASGRGEVITLTTTANAVEAQPDWWAPR